MRIAIRLFKVCLLLFTCTVLSSCWDQQLLRDRVIIKAVGFDVADEENIKEILAVTVIDVETVQEEIMSDVGSTPREVRLKIERSIHEKLDASKNRAVLISEELAKKDIYPLLDIFYRDPSSSLIAKFAIIEGDTEAIINQDTVGDILTGEFISDLIINSEESTLVPVTNLQIICPYLFDPGYDFTAPIIKMNNSNKISLEGSALFNNKIMTGKLNPNETVLFLLLSNQFAREASLTLPIYNEGERIEDNVTFNVEESKSKLTFDRGKISASYKLNLMVGVVEFPKDKLNQPEKVEELNEKISKQLTEITNTVIKNLQEANCDGLGLGRYVYAYHPELWKEIDDWKDFYPTMDVKAEVQVKIINSGIIN